MSKDKNNKDEKKGLSEREKAIVKRQSVRFQPDEGTYALIDPNPNSTDFDPSIPALVFSEAHKGAGIVVLQTQKLLTGEVVRIQVGNLPPLRAEIRWREQVDPQILKIGIVFLE